MARTSNRAAKREMSVTEQSGQAAAKIYKAVIYARLSSEDDRKIASHTADNQIALLRDYIDSQDDMELVECYCDRGFSGTKFDRPDFVRMIEDMKLGKFDCIVVKDLKYRILQSTFPRKN